MVEEKIPDWEREFFGDSIPKPNTLLAYEQMVEQYREWGYPKEFLEKRMEVIKRDKGECRVCEKKVYSFKKEEKMVSFQVHHINGDKRDNRMRNLVTLCMRDHQTVHTGNFHLRLRYFRERRDEIETKLSVLHDALFVGVSSPEEGDPEYGVSEKDLRKIEKPLTIEEINILKKHYPRLKVYSFDRKLKNDPKLHEEVWEVLDE